MKRLLIALLLASVLLCNISCLFFAPKFLPQTTTSTSTPGSLVSTSAEEAYQNYIPGQPIDPRWSRPPVPTSIPRTLSLADVVAKVKPSVVELENLGSGWIIDKRGIIVTCAHVVEGEDLIRIKLQNGKAISVDTKRIYQASEFDLAVIKIDATNLVAANLGNSTQLREGDAVVVIGNALGQGITSKEGNVSKFNPDIPNLEGFPLELIELSTPSMPGMSGAPVVNMGGQVIGIYIGGYIIVSNMSDAISINSALPIIEQLVKNGHILQQ